MTWTCPNCSRKFKTLNQAHSCSVVSLRSHLKGKSSEITEAFEKLLQATKKFGPVTVEPVKTAVMFRTESTFLSVQLKKDSMKIEFQLGRQIRKFPITRSFPLSKNRVLYSAVINSAKQVNKELIGWLREAYELSIG